MADNFDPRSVDENLFYKGVDKTKVHGARLHQLHSMTDPLDQGDSINPDEVADKPESEGQPPYPFDSGNTLLALTKKHNVRLWHASIVDSTESNGIRR